MNYTIPPYYDSMISKLIVWVGIEMQPSQDEESPIRIHNIG
jgi:biotin carboxylase